MVSYHPSQPGQTYRTQKNLPLLAAFRLNPCRAAAAGFYSALFTLLEKRKTSSTFAVLLLGTGLPHLQTVGRCDMFGQVLEYISLYSTEPVRLSIQSFHSRDMSFNQLQLLVQMCPKLKHVNLYVDEDMGNLLKPFEELENLEELKLLACNFYSDGIDDLLR